MDKFVAEEANINEANVEERFSIYWRLFQFSIIVLLGIGVVVNYKLFDSNRNETHATSGKALQWIVKTWALIQAIGWPILVFIWILFFEIVRIYGSLLNPCIIINTTHILVFAFLFFRLYLSLNSLILAIGRYAFVVQDDRIMKFGKEKMGKILIWSSFIIPLATSILALSVATLEYKGWFAEFKIYDDLCSATDIDSQKSNTTDQNYRSPIFKLAHASLSSSTTYGMYVVLIVTSIILYSNITEGIVYVRSAIFLIR